MSSYFYLHSTMFLLILANLFGTLPIVKFTFHYVSTYTVSSALDTLLDFIYIPLCFYLYENTFSRVNAHHHHLHSTMFLLIPLLLCILCLQVAIYIPLCFYLYQFSQCFVILPNLFTFHYVSTYTGRNASGVT